MASFPNDCLPPEGQYDLRANVFEAINKWAAPRGYVFINGRSTKEKSGKLLVTYAYNKRIIAPSSLTQRQRKSNTRGTGCQFSILAKES